MTQIGLKAPAAPYQLPVLGEIFGIQYVDGIPEIKDFIMCSTQLEYGPDLASHHLRSTDENGLAVFNNHLEVVNLRLVAIEACDGVSEGSMNIVYADFCCTPSTSSAPPKEGLSCRKQQRQQQQEPRGQLLAAVLCSSPPSPPAPPSPRHPPAVVHQLQWER